MLCNSSTRRLCGNINSSPELQWRNPIHRGPGEHNTRMARKHPIATAVHRRGDTLPANHWRMFHKIRDSANHGICVPTAESAGASCPSNLAHAHDLEFAALPTTISRAWRRVITIGIEERRIITQTPLTYRDIHIQSHTYRDNIIREIQA